MYKIANRWDHANAIKVEWNLGKRCNYDCSYCPSEIHDNTSPHTDIEILKSTIDKLASLGKPIRLSFTGGEPTVHPKFGEFIKYARHKGIQWISVTTNGTLPYEFYAQLAVDQLVFSIHFEYDWQRVYNTMSKVVDLTKIKVIAQIMCHQDYINQSMTVFARCVSAHIPATLRRIRWTQGDHDLFDDLRYHPDDLQWIKKQEATVQPNTLLFYKDKPMEQRHANDVIKLHLNKYCGWTCNAGIESLMINWDGDVHRATCRVGGSLGNIYNDTFVAPVDPIVCDRNFCTCAADIPLTKVKND